MGRRKTLTLEGIRRLVLAQLRQRFPGVRVELDVGRHTWAVSAYMPGEEFGRCTSHCTVADGRYPRALVASTVGDLGGMLELSLVAKLRREILDDMLDSMPSDSRWSNLPAHSRKVLSTLAPEITWRGVLSLGPDGLRERMNFMSILLKAEIWRFFDEYGLRWY